MAPWSTSDKRILLLALQKHGTSNMEIIQKELPHKTISEIRQIFEKFSKMAYNRWYRAESSEDNYPIKKWTKILKRINLKKQGYVTDIVPRVLKYIALYERRLKTTDINLGDCYTVLADIANGMPSKEMDDRSTFFLHKCLTRLATSLKEHNLIPYFECLNSVSVFNDLIANRTYSKKDTPNVTNALKIPDKLLQLTDNEKNSDIFS